MTFWPVALTAAFLLLIPRILLRHPSETREIRGPIRLLWWINRFYCGFWHRLSLNHEAPLPAEGGAILIANHTCGIDNFLLQAGCERILGFVIVQEWYDHWLCHPFCRLIRAIPVKRDGRDTTAVRTALRGLAQGRVLPIFPEGKINPDAGRSFLEPKPGAAFLALHADVPVIPAYISGTPPTRDIWAAIYTPSEARIVFGEPIDLSEYRKRGRRDKRAIAEVSAIFMAAIRALSNVPETAVASPSEPAPEALTT